MRSIFVFIVFFLFYNPPVYPQKIELKELNIEPSKVYQGEKVKIYIRLINTGIFKEDYFLFCHLEGKDFVNADIFLPVAPILWKKNTPIEIGPFYLHIPWNLTPGDYRLKMGLAKGINTPLGLIFKKIPWRGRRDFYVAKIRVREKEKFDYKSQEFIAGFLEGVYKVFKEKIFFNPRKLKDKLILFSALNEYEIAEFLVIPGNRDSKIKIRIEDLEADNNKKISRDNIRLYRIEYVRTKKPYYNTKRIGFWPDPLIEIKDNESIFINKDEIQPFLLEIYIPEETLAGFYEGDIVISSISGIKRISLGVKVFNFKIPKKSTLKTAFDVYENQFLRYFPQKESEADKDYRERIRKIIDAYYIDMLKHKMNPIHNVGNPRFLKVEKDRVILDFKDFDKRVNFFLKRGQTCFAIGEEWPWWRKEAWPQDKWYGFRGPQVLEWTFREIGEHLEEKRWLDLSYTYILDETYNRVEEIYGLIHRGYPGIKNLLTQTPRLDLEDVDIWCVRINNLLRSQVKEARRVGKEIWMYVAGTTRPFPNLNIDVPSIEARIIPWICFKYDLKGFLYWCVNWWPENPWKSADTYKNQNGNGFLYYPSEKIVPSLRLKLFREGLEDYEYLQRLKGIYLQNKDKKIRDIFQDLDNLIVNPGFYQQDLKKYLELKKRIGIIIESYEESD